MKYWLGIDVGTGGSRALLVRADGAVVSGVTAAHEDILMLKPLWAEQRPQDWWNASRQAVRRLLAETGVRGEQIAGVGLSGQMHGLTLLDAADQVIRPALIWCDQRSQEQVDWINARAGEDMVLEQTANPVLTGFTAPKLLWVRDHDPASYERVRRMLLPKDYIRFCPDRGICQRGIRRVGHRPLRRRAAALGKTPHRQARDRRGHPARGRGIPANDRPDYRSSS